MTRGRKPLPCPDRHELLVAHAFDPRLAIIARQMSANPKQVRRWLGEVGIAVPLREQRSRRETPQYVRVVTAPLLGKRVRAKLYKVWEGMALRCYYPNQQSYKWYGARGIGICSEWKNYDAFRAWAVSHGYRKGLKLDRIDPDGNYESSNCRWATHTEQMRNTRRMRAKAQGFQQDNSPKDQ